MEWKRYNVSQALITYNEKVLLVGNDYGEADLMWSLPGGRLEAGEQHDQALIREVKEETGLIVRPTRLLYVVDARTLVQHRHYITCVFEAQPYEPFQAEPILSSGLDPAVKALEWVEFERVPQILIRPSLGEALVNYLYYGDAKMPRRYWVYPEYLASDWKPLGWPPLGEEID